MSLRSMLNATCTISLPTEAKDTATGVMNTTGYTTVASAVPCSIQARSGSDAVQHMRETGERLFDVFFEASQLTVLKVQHRLTGILVNGSADEWSGRELSVTSPPIDNAGRRAYARVSAVEKTGGGVP